LFKSDLEMYINIV